MEGGSPCCDSRNPRRSKLQRVLTFLHFQGGKWMSPSGCNFHMWPLSGAKDQTTSTWLFSTVRSSSSEQSGDAGAVLSPDWLLCWSDSVWAKLSQMKEHTERTPDVNAVMQLAQRSLLFFSADSLQCKYCDHSGPDSIFLGSGLWRYLSFFIVKHELSSNCCLCHLEIHPSLSICTEAQFI